jgi:DNA-binding LacI/PurR family transcriptional regulator
MEKKTSLKDIAYKVGVSTALVSYVLNGKEQEKRVGRQVDGLIIVPVEHCDKELEELTRKDFPFVLIDRGSFFE